MGVTVTGRAPGGGSNRILVGHLAEVVPRVLRLSWFRLRSPTQAGQCLTMLEFSNPSISEVNESSRTGYLISQSYTLQLLGVRLMTLLLLF